MLPTFTKQSALLIALSLGSTTSFASGQTSGYSLDYLLRHKLNENNVTSVTPPAQQEENLVELGRSLFYDKEISGRRNMSCSTCHSPTLGSADAQSQSRGQGAIGLGPSRRQDGHEFFQFLPRNTLSLWNRGVTEWTTMFWDGRLQGSPETGYTSPAGDDTPQNFTSVLAAFSIFPITPDEEMRGFSAGAVGIDGTVFTEAQRDVFGNENEIAGEGITNDSFVEIWDLVTARIVGNAGYDELLNQAFPSTPESELDITNLSEAIGAFMIDEFTALNSPFDQYLAGDNDALSNQAKRGALLFYGRANCASCHSGGLQTDFDFHNIAAPQIGTGRAAAAPLDLGRGAITENIADNFKFRTPSLRNVELEAPYFHNGAYANIEDAVRHHLSPAESLINYDVSQIEPELVELSNTPSVKAVQRNPLLLKKLILTASPLLRVEGGPITEPEFDDLLAFLSSLTDPSSLNMFDVVPDDVPSGLTLAD